MDVQMKRWTSTYRVDAFHEMLEIEAEILRYYSQQPLHRFFWRFSFHLYLFLFFFRWINTKSGRKDVRENNTDILYCSLSSKGFTKTVDPVSKNEIVSFPSSLQSHMEKLYQKNTMNMIIPIFSSLHFGVLLYNPAVELAYLFDSRPKITTLFENVERALQFFTGSKSVVLEKVFLNDSQNDEWECGHMVIRKLFLIFMMMISQLSINTPYFAFEPYWFERVVIPVLDKDDPFVKRTEIPLDMRLSTFADNLKKVFNFVFPILFSF